MKDKFGPYIEELDSDIAESEIDFDRSFLAPQHGMHGGLKLLIGAVVLNSAVIAAFAVGYINQVTPLSLAHVEPVSGADKDEGISAPFQLTEVQHLAGSLSIPDIAAISLGSGLPLPVEIEKPLSAVPIIVKNQVAAADNTTWRIQLSSLSGQTNTETAWKRLQQTNPDLLDNLTLHVQSAELSNGTFYRLQAGPVLDRVAAVSLCNALKSRNQDCLVVAP